MSKYQRAVGLNWRIIFCGRAKRKVVKMQFGDFFERNRYFIFDQIASVMITQK